MDTLAARLREAFLGTETGEAVPFDELKDAVRDRWQRVADAARVPAEVPTPIRVPFSDDQIERMAEAAHTRRMRDEERTKQWKDLPLFAKDAWRHGIRAALAAGGLEPCAVPEYDPADVALAPTGHVLRDRLVDAEAKIERQRMNLNQLYMANAALRNDINIAVCNAMDRLPDAPWKDKTATEAVWLLSLAVGNLRAEVDEDNAAAASVNDLLVQVQNLTAERDAQEIELADLRFYQREFAAVSAERDALREAHMKECHVEPSDCPPNKGYLAEARAAIAHLATRPEGLPDEHVLAAIMCEANGSTVSVLTGDDGYSIVARAALTALRPWLRDPVGWEMDVHPDQLELYKWVTEPDGGYAYAAQQALDLCRNRIRPVYECKECAARAGEMMRPQPVIECAECRQWRNANDELVRRATAARAALDGE